ncbi:MAG: hypothetical protein CMO01_07080 [Thalassobius sp.]|nr:hypothetical protein [Thalassovita sp.]
MHKLTETLKKKWAEYLFEVVVIIISVLGAFSLNNWNEQRKSAYLEVSFLKDIQAGFARLEYNFSQNVLLEEQVSADMSNILYHIENDLVYSETVAVSMNRSLFYMPEIWADYGPYESLKAVGLQVITNDSLRSFVSRQFGQRLPGRIREQNQINKYIESFNSQKPLWFTGEKGNIPWDFEALKQDKKFIHLVNFSKNRAEDNIQYYKEVIPALKFVFEAFDREIQSLE